MVEFQTEAGWQRGLVPLATTLLFHLSCPCVGPNSQDRVVTSTQSGRAIPFCQAPASPLHLMQLGLGIKSVFSKQHKTISLETSGPPLTLNVFTLKPVLSAPVVLSIWQVS